jgi:uncharacterized membrane protein YhfC
MLSYPRGVVLSPILLFAVQALLVCAGVIALAIWLHRRLPAPWRAWIWGALTFVASQVVRLPILIGLTALSQTLGLNFGQEGNFWFNAVVLSFSAGLFEETARYLVLRFLAKDVRGWNDAVMFGAGHGGIEAILIVGGSALSNLFLLANADALLTQTRAAAPAQADALAAQIEALRGVGAGLIAASLIERVFALMLHIGLTVMVMRAVEGGGVKWWLAAIAVHGLANLAALTAQRLGGIVAAEAVVGVFGLAMLAFTLRQRPASPASQPAPL